MNKLESPSLSPDDDTNVAVSLAKMQSAIENLAESVSNVFKLLQQEDSRLRSMHESATNKWDSELGHLYERLSAQERPNYAVWIAAIAVCVTIVIAAVGGAWALVSLQVERVTSNRVAPLESRSTISETERASMRGDIRDLQGAFTESVASRKEHDAMVDEKLAEVETQFDAMSQMLNIQFADQQRVDSMMWDSMASTGTKLPRYPTAPFFYPNVSNRRK